MDRLAACIGLVMACGIGLARAEDSLTSAGNAPVLTYEGNAAANTSGGERRGSTYTENLHVQLLLNGDQLLGQPGLSAYVDGLWISGGQPSKFVGDAQGVSNIAAPPALRLYEAWLQYNSMNNGISILLGRYDLNTEFYRLGSAGLFLNSSFQIGPEFGLSGFAGPSIFPDTSLALRLGYKPSLSTVLRMAVLDGTPLNPQNGSPNPFNPHDGVLLVAEAAWLTRPSPSNEPANFRFRIGRHGTPIPYDDKIAIGAWYYTADFNALDVVSLNGRPVLHHGEAGAYLLVDRLLFEAGHDRRLTGFL